MNDAYNTYDVLDFAQDDQFISWVKSADSKNGQLWKAWIKEHPEKASIIEEAKRIVLGIKVEEQEPPLAKIQTLWDKIETEIEQETPVIPINKKAPKLLWLRYAAAVAVVILAIFLLYQPGTTVETANAELVTHLLPDGSKVELNADSKIWVNPKDWEENRSVRLEGEAFFEVEKGSTFTVETSRGRVQVLGTSFNVFSRDAFLEVECFTGRVEVTLPEGNSKSLSAGLGVKAMPNENLSAIFEIDTTIRAGWRIGKIDMDDVSLQRALDEIERQFDQEIEVQVSDSLRNKLYDFYFETSNLDSALTSVTFIGSLELLRKDEKIIIRELK